MRWLKGVGQSVRDNAIYDGIKFVIGGTILLAWPAINAYLASAWQTPWYWKLNACLILLAVVVFCTAIGKFSQAVRASRRPLLSQEQLTNLQERKAQALSQAQAPTQEADNERHKRFLIKAAIAHLSSFGTTTTKVGNQPPKARVFGKKEPIQALILMSEMFKSEEEVMSICSHLHENTSWSDPFALYESKHGAGAFNGKRLKFLRDASISGRSIKNDDEALQYLASVWAEKNGLPKRPYSFPEV